MESVSSMRIGWHAAYLKKNDLFGILGFKTESEARQAAGVGKSTWYVNIRLAEAFEGHGPRAQFVLDEASIGEGAVRSAGVETEGRKLGAMGREHEDRGLRGQVR